MTKPEATNTLLLSDSTVCHLSAADQIYNCTNLRTLEQHDYSVDSLVIPLFDSDNMEKILFLFIVDPSFPSFAHGQDLRASFLLTF